MSLLQSHVISFMLIAVACELREVSSSLGWAVFGGIFSNPFPFLHALEHVGPWLASPRAQISFPEREITNIAFCLEVSFLALVQCGQLARIVCVCGGGGGGGVKYIQKFGTL